jgi:sarcosine oxidase subunit beta
VAKTIVCACEDVTLADVRHAFAKGHRDVESVKRYTGFGTGPCQGKSCLALVARELARLGATPGELAPFTARPPAAPLPLAALAELDPSTLPLEGGAPLEPPPRELPRPSAALPDRAKVVIVGGGIMGLALAYHLCRRGLDDVLVLERGYLNAGASGRNGGGVRMQWTTPAMVRLARRSIERMRTFATEMGVNVWLRQGGYLFLAPDVAQLARLERNLRVHEAEGLRTRILDPRQACAIVPELDGTRFVGAAYNPDDGVVFPWPFLWGYATRAEALGARVCTFTRVTGFESAGRRLSVVHTDRGAVGCDVVVNAAGAWAKEVGLLAGVALPNRPTRHEILVTSPLKPWLDPLVSVLGTGLYFSQSMRGELVGGMGDPAEPEGLAMGSTLRFAARFARAITACAPVTAGIEVIRQWAGCYDVTPDNNPILGAAGYDNFLQVHGFVGHGFMMAPAVTEAMAEWMTGGAKDDIFDRFTLERFERDGVVGEDFIIG